MARMLGRMLGKTVEKLVLGRAWMRVAWMDVWKVVSSVVQLDDDLVEM